MRPPAMPPCCRRGSRGSQPSLLTAALMVMVTLVGGAAGDVVSDAFPGSSWRGIAPGPFVEIVESSTYTSKFHAYFGTDVGRTCTDVDDTRRVFSSTRRAAQKII